jgi:hypothetical protein
MRDWGLRLTEAAGAGPTPPIAGRPEEKVKQISTKTVQ